MIEASEKVVVLADAKKFEKDSLRVFADFKNLDIIIVDQPIRNQAQLMALEKNQVELIIAEQ